MKKTFKSLLSVIIVAAMMLGILALTACGEEKLTPFEYLDKAMKKTEEARMNSGIPDMSDVIANAKSGSLALNGSDYESFLGVPLESAKLNISNCNDILSATLEATVGGQIYDASVIASAAAVALTSNLLFGGKYYGVDLTKDASDYEGSYLAELGVIEKIFEYKEMITSAMSSLSSEEMEKLTADFESYVKAEQDALIEAEKVTLTKNEDGGKTVVVTSDNEAIEIALRTIFAKAKDDEDLKKTLNDASSLISSVAKETELEINVDDLFAELDDEEKLNKLIEDMNSAFDLSIVITETTDKNDIIQTISCSVSIKPAADATVAEAIELSVDIDITKADESVITVDLSKIKNAPVSNITFTVKTENIDNKVKTSLSFSASLNNTTISSTLGYFEYDTVTSKYTLTVYPEIVALSYDRQSTGSEIQISGEIKATNTDASFTVDTITMTAADQSQTINLGLTLTLSTTADPVTMPEYTDILAITADEFQEILMAIFANVLNPSLKMQ